MSDSRRKGRKSWSRSRSRSRGKKHGKSSVSSTSSHNNKKNYERQGHDKSSNNRRQSRSRSYSRPRSGSPDDTRRHKNTRDRQYTGGNTQQWNFKSKFEESKWLAIEGLPEEMTARDIEEKLTQVSADCGTSVYEEIKLVSYLASAYVQYPSLSAASKTLYHLKGKVKLRDQFYSIDFYNSGLLQPAIPVVAGTQPQVIYEPAATSDWICDNCEYKNFAKRSRCNKCERPRTNNCRVVPTISSKSLQAQSGLTGQEGNTSLMIRGQVVSQVTEQEVFEAFDSIAKVKGVRLLKHKGSNQQRDFAFVEFFTVEEAERVLAIANEPDFTLAGQPVQVIVSRNKRFDEHPGFDQIPMSNPQTLQQPQFNPVPIPGAGTPFDYTQYYQQMYGHLNPQAAFIEKAAAAAGYQIQPFPKPPDVHMPYQQGIVGGLNVPTLPVGGIGLQLGGINEMQQSNELEMQQLLIKQALENAKNHSLLIAQQQHKDKEVPKKQSEQKEEGNTGIVNNNNNNLNPQVHHALVSAPALTHTPTATVVPASISVPVHQTHILQASASQISNQIQAAFSQSDPKNATPEIVKKDPNQNSLKNIVSPLLKQSQPSTQNSSTITQQPSKAEEDAAKRKTRLEKLKEASANNSLDEEPDSKSMKLISFELGTSSLPQKPMLYICSICKRKFETDKLVELHQTYSKMHKENLGIYGLK